MILGFLKTFLSSVALLSCMFFSNNVHAQQATNPIIFAEVVQVPLTQNNVYSKIDCDFANKKDEAKFSYSIDGKVWNPIGNILKMTYDIPQFGVANQTVCLHKSPLHQDYSFEKHLER